MSKILIIGNGPSALKNKCGELIDSDKWDVVMRFNRWDKNDDGTKHNDYSKYIGTRCDYWMINDLRLQIPNTVDRAMAIQSVTGGGGLPVALTTGKVKRSYGVQKQKIQSPEKVLILFLH